MRGAGLRDEIIDLSTSPEARPDAAHTGLGRQLYVQNPRFLNPYLTAGRTGAMGPNARLEAGWE